jgi:hypothetical protein
MNPASEMGSPHMAAHTFFENRKIARKIAPKNLVFCHFGTPPSTPPRVLCVHRARPSLWSRSIDARPPRHRVSEHKFLVCFPRTHLLALGRSRDRSFTLSPSPSHCDLPTPCSPLVLISCGLLLLFRSYRPQITYEVPRRLPSRRADR